MFYKDVIMYKTFTLSFPACIYFNTHLHRNKVIYFNKITIFNKITLYTNNKGKNWKCSKLSFCTYIDTTRDSKVSCEHLLLSAVDIANTPHNRRIDYSFWNLAGTFLALLIKGVWHNSFYKSFWEVFASVRNIFVVFTTHLTIFKYNRHQ